MERIPESEWQWQGYAGHFCMAHACLFHLTTVVGNVMISSVGHLVTKNVDEFEPEALGAEKGSFYETYVFSGLDKHKCGCYKPAIGLEAEGRRFKEHTDCEVFHMECCQRAASGAWQKEEE